MFRTNIAIKITSSIRATTNTPYAITVPRSANSKDIAKTTVHAIIFHQATTSRIVFFPSWFVCIAFRLQSLQNLAITLTECVNRSDNKYHPEYDSPAPAPPKICRRVHFRCNSTSIHLRPEVLKEPRESLREKENVYSENECSDPDDECKYRTGGLSHCGDSVDPLPQIFTSKCLPCVCRSDRASGLAARRNAYSARNPVRAESSFSIEPD